MKVLLLPFLLVSCLATTPLMAGSATTMHQELSKYDYGEHTCGLCKGRWVCMLGKGGGTVMVKLDSITSISRHTYMLNGSQQITEVTIDTRGNNSIRFYCMSGNNGKRLLDKGSNLRDIMDKYADDTTHYPSKKFPEGTCSHNIEYQVSSPNLLDIIYASVANAWVLEVPNVLRIKP